jgi:hypothetical protein
MKFTKFIPLVCAVAFASTAAFADPISPVNSIARDYTINVPQVFTIEQEAYTGTVTSPTIDSTFTTLSWTGTLGATYKVSSNIPNKVFYIKATAQGATSQKAFNTDVNNIRVAFANTASAPADTAIEEVLKASPDSTKSANAFAVDFSLGAVTTDEGVLSTPSMTNQELVYTITTPGTFHIPFTMATQTHAGTFSSLDQTGDYKATITITDVAS